MSYNTRRSATGRGMPSPQMNYHQQPAARSGGPGYTTQPAFQTKDYSGYSTTIVAPPTTQPKPPVQQPPLPSTPAPPDQPTAPLNTPDAKPEPTTSQDTPQGNTSPENGQTKPGPKLPFWLLKSKKKPTEKLTNKEKRARQNAKLRRLLNPKNAMALLNELKPGAVKFTVREEAGWGFVAAIDIDGQTYTGTALNMSRAKVVASENAVKHLLLKMMAKSQEAASSNIKKEDTKVSEEAEQSAVEGDGEGGDPPAKRARVEPAEDEIPWGSLAAFALHKLITEWQYQDVIAAPEPDDKCEEQPQAEEPYFTRRPGPPPDFGYPPRRMPPPGVFGRGRGFAPFPPRGPPPPHFGGAGIRRPPPSVASSFLPPGSTFYTPRGDSSMSAYQMTKIPDDASNKHPVMLLNQLRPNLTYVETMEGLLPNAYFKISVYVDGHEYFGIGKSKKDAKKNAAKEALAIMGVNYEGSPF